jgi:hypothetical protein
MISLSTYDGRCAEPPYVADLDEAVSNERERCADIAEHLEFRLDVSEWLALTKKQISERMALAIADAIRHQ